VIGSNRTSTVRETSMNVVREMRDTEEMEEESEREAAEKTRTH
jgi:hypothetical protein